MIRVVGSVLAVGLIGLHDNPQIFFDLDPIRAVDHVGMLSIYDKAQPIPGKTSCSMLPCLH